jgi:ABC-2 type transport system permease protein
MKGVTDMKFFTDLGLLFRRNVITTLRNPVWLIIGLFQPILYLLLFAPLLGNLSMIPGFPQGGAYTVFTPGLLVMLALFGTAFVGFGLVDQIRSGVVERFLVTPVRRSAILLGYVLRDIVTLLVQSTIVILIALPFGLKVSFPGLLLTYGMMALTAVLMSSCSYALALTLKSEDSLASVLNTLSAPLLLLSGITLPLALAPKIIQSIASVIPFSYEVNAARSLFLGNFNDSAIGVGIVFLAVLAALSFLWAARSFRRGTA